MSDNVNWPMEMDRRNLELARMTEHRDKLLRRIEVLEPYVEAFRREEKRADDLARDLDDLRAALAARIEKLEAALREAERFISYLANETDGIFVGSGTPATCLVMIRAALNQQNPDR